MHCIRSKYTPAFRDPSVWYVCGERVTEASEEEITIQCDAYYEGDNAAGYEQM